MFADHATNRVWKWSIIFSVKWSAKWSSRCEFHKPQKKKIKKKKQSLSKNQANDLILNVWETDQQ